MQLPIYTENRIEIGLLNDVLLTRIESNIDDVRACRNVVVYSHGLYRSSFRFLCDSGHVPAGFPDSSVVPMPSDSTKECGHFSSRFPRNLCGHLLKTLNSVAFVAFNCRGVPGSSQTPAGSVLYPYPHFLTLISKIAHCKLQTSC